jgi:hypothetical protein
MSTKILNGSYPLAVYDHEISDALQNRVYNFLLDSEYYINFYDQPHSNWNPRTKTLTTPRNYPAGYRLPLAWDAASLEHRAPVVYELWQEIDRVLEHKFVIEGIQEGMTCMVGVSPLSCITKADGSPGRANAAWRVYGGGLGQELKARTKAIHRDCVDLDAEGFYTLVYFANQEWHPQYYGETLFHDNDATTGDFTGKFEDDQPRNFPIGDVENVVAPRPGRFMNFDSRYFHQTKPGAVYAPEQILAIIFRLKKV